MVQKFDVNKYGEKLLWLDGQRNLPFIHWDQFSSACKKAISVDCFGVLSYEGWKGLSVLLRTGHETAWPEVPSLVSVAKLLLTNHGTDAGWMSGLRQNWLHQELAVHEETKLSSPTCTSNQCHPSSGRDSSSRTILSHPNSLSLYIISNFCDLLRHAHLLPPWKSCPTNSLPTLCSFLLPDSQFNEMGKYLYQAIYRFTQDWVALT